MKVYISADIEGVAGIAHWDEAIKSKADYQEFREQMTLDVAAACEAALEAGATEILVKDAHASGRNIIAAKLPEKARVIRGWSGHPYAMLQELDASFDAVAMLGYHAAATGPSNPLSHTNTLKYAKILLNGELASEFHLHSYVAATQGVPVVALSGDAGICAAAKAFNPSITAVETGIGIGDSSTGLHPHRARREIAAGVKRALQGDKAACRIALPARFEIEVWFKKHADAYSASFYPGARAIGSEAVGLASDDFFEIARMLRFV